MSELEENAAHVGIKSAIPVFCPEAPPVACLISGEATTDGMPHRWQKWGVIGAQKYRLCRGVFTVGDLQKLDLGETSFTVTKREKNGI